MAAQQFTVDFIPAKEGLKKDVAVTGTVVDPTANQLYVGFGSAVETRRSNEIINGLLWLEQGISERNLLDVQFNGAILVTCASINALTESNRRTGVTLVAASFATDDIVIGMGTAVTAANQVEMIRSALGDLRRAVQEFLYKNG